MISSIEGARLPHRGVFITGPDRLEVLEDTLPEEAFTGDFILTESLGNCRCSSDRKAIHQFTRHARIPASATQVALGHECIHRIVSAPPGSPVAAGDLVLITPGQFASPHDPETFQPDPEHGVLASMGYSYRYLGGLRQYNAIPKRAVEIVRQQGFGNLFNRVPPHAGVSLATLAHAEPFACCYGTMKNMFFTGDDGEFRYSIPARARVAFLGGTARMAMIKLTILAARPEDELPERIAITGSRKKLDELPGYAVIQSLRERGVDILLIDRRAPDVLERLLAPGKYDAVFTNFPAQEVYDQAVAIIERGGNLNNYAGAVDPEIAIEMAIPPVPRSASLAEEARARIAEMHHNVTPTEPLRARGLADGGGAGASVLLVGFEGQRERLDAFLGALPAGVAVRVEGWDAGELDGRFPALRFDGDAPPSDVFIAGTGRAAAEAYARVELGLARCAAINLVDGDTTIRVRSKHSHYQTRHQICGPTVPFTMTNTSEPLSADMAIQGERPIDFDWLVKGVAGLDHAAEMIQDVTEREPFGSFFALTQIPGLPYVEVGSRSFREKAAALRAAADASPAATALESAADVIERNDERWSRAAEETIYTAFGVEYPLA